MDNLDLAALLTELESDRVERKASDAPPVRFNSRTWIRIGPRRDQATLKEERRLNEKRRAGDLPFDLHPLRSASLDDLNLDFFQHQYL